MELKFTQHVLLQMLKRSIPTAHIKDAIMKGETIENYPNDKPYPSFLKLQFVSGNPLHVVAAQTATETVVITAYFPDPLRWKANFKERIK